MKPMSCGLASFQAVPSVNACDHLISPVAASIPVIVPSLATETMVPFVIAIYVIG
jgi:hypothetical protein